MPTAPDATRHLGIRPAPLHLVDPALAERARANLAPWPQAVVVAGDGIAHQGEPADLVVVNAGVTHPQAHWLDQLPEGGRLLVPLTTAGGQGGAEDKIAAMEAAGITVSPSPSELGETLAALLKG